MFEFLHRLASSCALMVHVICQRVKVRHEDDQAVRGCVLGVSGNELPGIFWQAEVERTTRGWTDYLQVRICHRELSKSEHTTSMIGVVLSLTRRHKRLRIAGPEGLHNSIAFNSDRCYPALDSRWWQHTGGIHNDVVSFQCQATIAPHFDQL